MNFMKFLRKNWLIIVVLIILILIFYPKHCGNWGTAISPDATYKDCTCIGIKYSSPILGGAYITCFGIPTSYSCYYYTKEPVPGAELQKIEVPCD